MVIVEESILIDLPPEQAWEKMQDISTASDYIPGVTDIQIVTPQAKGNGARRMAFSQKYPHWTHESVDQWEDSKGFRLRLHKDNKRTYFYAKEFYFIYAMEELDGNTLFKPRIEYKRSLLGWFMTPFLNKGIPGILKQICHAMKEYYETGESITPERQAEIKAMLKGR